MTRGPDTEPSTAPSTAPGAAPTAPDRAPESFAPATRAWFDAAFPGGPTPVQARAWRAIGRGDHALVIAPTGSGKTLAAFLSAIDHLGRRRPDADRRPRARRKSAGVRVLYISPLKALGADVERNLARPLAGITAAAQQLGDGIAPITVAVRSGDTPAAQRRRLRTRPPDILITTPESLYLMLTSQARSTLRTVETVIVDEIHSVAGQKRGTHLALSLERLDDLLPRPAQRIGLSATVCPREEIARFLGGTRPVTIIADDGRALPEVGVRVPMADMANLPAAQDRQAAMEQALSGSSRHARGGLPAGSSRAWRSDRALRRALHGGHSEKVPPAASRTISSIWPHIETAVLDQVLAHRTTVVFVNSRGLCERLTARLNEAYARRMAPGRTEGLESRTPLASSGAQPGSAVPAAPPPLHRDSSGAGDDSHTRALPSELPVIARAHHGSVSKEQRLAVEGELKSGRLRCVVATASLELGIDMGAIDLVLQVAPPPSVASGLQRVGRANHHVGGRPRGTIYPVQRTQLIDAAVASEGMRQGRIERTALVANALDVLAQHTVAAAAMEDLDAEAWYATVRRAAPYRDLPRGAFDSVLELLAGGYATADLADFAPRLTWDRDSGVLAARPGAQRLAVGASGTIPDRGLFPVVLPEGAQEGGRRRVGELDEEMVYETSVGDVITLGTSTWRVREITGDRVVVDPAPGRSARLPFWHGEGPARPASAGAAKGAFLRAAGAALPAGTDSDAPARLGEDGDDGASAQVADSGLAARLAEDGLDANARRNLLSLLREQRAATGVLPSDTTLVLEHCRDESGAWRLIVHSPWGRRVHEPWAMAIRERARTTMGFQPQIVVADDGIVLQLPAAEEAPAGAGLVVFEAEEIARLVRSRIGGTALFAARFRECAARALLMPATQPGRRTPLWLQRVKAAQLLQASRRFESFPIGVEAARECLQDVYDLPALTGLMERIASGAARVVEVTTRTPSPFAGPLLFGYIGALLYQEDLPQAERSAHLLSLDPDVVAELMGQDAGGLLDERVVGQVEAELQRLAASRRVPADAEGVADLLRELGPLSLEEVAARCRGGDESPAPPEAAREALIRLEGSRRALRLEVAGTRRWARVEDAAVLREALGAVVPDWAVPEGGGGGTGSRPVRVRQAAARSPLGELVVRYVRTHALITAEQVAGVFGLGRVVVREALERLADEGAVMRLGGQGGHRWMAPEVFRRVRARSLARAREAIRPVAPVVLQRLVLVRAGLAEPRGGMDGLAEALAALEGVWLPAALWEEVVLPARVPDYRPAMLDELLASGEVVWQARGAPRDRPGGAERGASTGAAVGAARDTRAVTAPGEIAFFPYDSPLAPGVGTPIEGVEAAELWARVLAGEATVGSFEPVRRSLRPGPAAAPPRRVRSRRGRGRYAGLAAEWSAARAGAGPGAIPGPGGGGGRAAGGGGLGGVDAVVACGAAWHALSEPEVSPEAGAVALIESLLDRYGVISRDIALVAGLPGGLTPLVPVLRRLEETGALLRGRFVEGQGPFQFTEREAVEALRSVPVEEDGAAVVLDVKDPACLVGRGVAWPEAVLPAGVSGRETDGQWSAPPRRRGASVVLVGGRPILHATERLRALTSFTADRGELREALSALVAYERRVMVREDRSSRRVVESVNGVPAIDRGVSVLLAEAGLVRDPRGMRLGPMMQR